MFWLKIILPKTTQRLFMLVGNLMMGLIHDRNSPMLVRLVHAFDKLYTVSCWWQTYWDLLMVVTKLTIQLAFVGDKPYTTTCVLWWQALPPLKYIVYKCYSCFRLVMGHFLSSSHLSTLVTLFLLYHQKILIIYIVLVTLRLSLFCNETLFLL